MNGRAARSTSLVAICRHCGLVAEDVVGVADRVGLRNLVAAVPRRGRDLPGEVFASNALALLVVCHAVSGDSILNFANVRLGFFFENFCRDLLRDHSATSSHQALQPLNLNTKRIRLEIQTWRSSTTKDSGRTFAGIMQTASVSSPLNGLTSARTYP